jgi:hypothetical protein
MGTTVDDLIDLKDEAVAACHAVVAAWEKGDLAAAANYCSGVIEQAELYDAAEEDPQAVSIEDHERLKSLCELEDCPMRDPDGKRSHTRRECES